MKELSILLRNKMKRLSIFLMAVLLGVASLWARPALQGTRRVQQPDGTFVTIRLVGDEYRHFNTTADGYSLVRNAEGYYVYACQDASGQLAPTTLIAHDAEERTPADVAYLQQVGRIVPPVSASMQQIMQQNQTSRARALAVRKASRYDYSKFRGLVILVEYNDCDFRYSDYGDIMEKMINADNYTGDSRTNTGTAQCTGSMRDYYRDNSNGIFVPTFDVVGPVKIDRSQYYPDVNKNDYDATKTLNSVQLMIDACTAADSQVNFADYDVDGDGTVDMIYFIFSGLAAYVSGNDERLLWPHQYDISYIKTVRKDGVKLGRYACSTELFGTKGKSILEGIGTLCHEFSHVLGLPDFYDTDNVNPEYCENPGNWSVMAAGADLNSGRTPCGYSLFERYALGFAQPQVISEVGEFSLEAVSSSNSGYRLNTPVNREFFMIENRQKKKWDAYLPGHGMLIFRVDSTNANAWNYNTVNDNPNHPYYQLVRANGSKTDSQGGKTFIVDTGADPFPGTANVTAIDNNTTPANLLTWSKKTTPLGLRNIKEKSGIITFETFDVNVVTNVSLPQTAIIGLGTSMQLTPTLEPAYASATMEWTSSNEAVATVDATGNVTGIAEGTADITVTVNNSLTATCQVTVRQFDVAATIADFRAMEPGSEAMLQLQDAQVLYATGKLLYVRDASGSIVISGTGISANVDDVLNGIIYGAYTENDRMPMLTPVEGITSALTVNVAAGSEAKARPVHVSQLNSDLYADKVVVKNAALVSDGGIWIKYDDKKIRLFNTFSITSPKIVVPTDLTKRYDVTAIFGTNTLKGEVIDELYLLKSPKAVSDFTVATAISLPEALAMVSDRTTQLVPTLTPADASVMLRWSSDNEQVATVDDNGLVTTLADGIAVITVTDLESGLQASCTITVGECPVAADIAAFKSLPNGSEATLTLTDAQVLYVYKDDIFVRDTSGAIMLSGTGLSATKNQMLNGQVTGLRKSSNRMPVFAAVSGITDIKAIAVTDGSEALPRPTTIDLLSDDGLCDMVLVEATPLESNGGIFAYGKDVRARLYNSFGISGIKVPSVINNKYFNITAIFGTAVLTDGTVTYELKLLKSPEETTPPAGIAEMAADADGVTSNCFDLNGRRLTSTPKQGLYLVRRNGQYVKVIK